MDVMYGFIAIAIVILIILYYMFSKEQEQSRKMRVIASAVENVNRDMYNLEKRLLEHIAQLQTDVKELEPYEDRAQISQRVNAQLHSVSEPMADSIYDLEEHIDNLEEKFDKRLSFLESTLRNLSMPSAVQSMDNDKIVSLYQEGISVENIAKELRVAPQDVTMILKLYKLR